MCLYLYASITEKTSSVNRCELIKIESMEVSKWRATCYTIYVKFYRDEREV